MTPDSPDGDAPGRERPLLSVVTPVFNEVACLDAYRDAVVEVLFAAPDLDVEVLLVDDGSTDGSWDVIERLCAADSRFRGLRLSRNFGSHVALTAGIDHARGDAVATLAADLQDPPEVVLQFVERWRDGAQVVWGQRQSRGDTPARIRASNAFSALVRRYAMPKNSQFTTGSFLLLDRRVADCFREYREHNRITFALVAWTGFRQERVAYERKARFAGASHWTFSQLLKAMYSTFIGFSGVPVRLITWLGVTSFLLTLPLIGYVIIEQFRRNVFPGWTGLMLTMLVFFGILFLTIGLMGEYLYRIYAEVTRRPLYFLSDERGVRTGPSEAAAHLREARQQ